MSDDKTPETEPDPIGPETKGTRSTGIAAAEDSAAEGEAHSRRRGLVILVIVVVVAVVAALIAWSVTSGASPSAGGPSSGAGTSQASDPAATPGANGTPPATVQPGGGEITDDIFAFDDDAAIGGDVTVALSDIEAVEGEAEGPGEIGGPSIRFTVTFTNDSDTAYALSGAVTNVYYGDEQTPAIPLRGPGGVVFPAEVAAGSTATGTFIFNVPEESRDTVRITVDYSAAEPAVVFEGPGPT